MGLRAASLPLDLEHRPERAVNGAAREQSCSAPTEVQALVLSCAGRTRALVGADVVWFGAAQAADLRREIAARIGIEERDVALCATHTHGTPNPDRRFAYGEFSDTLLDDMRGRILAAVEAAIGAAVRPVRLVFGQAEAPGIAVHRRRIAWTRRGLRPIRRVQNLPNTLRPIDERVSVLALQSIDDGAYAAVITHFTCHPVADPRDCRGADYPGLLRTLLKARLGAATHCVFLQGFCGDTRPRLVHSPRGLKDHALEAIVGPRFRPARPGDSQALSEGIAAGALSALANGREIAAQSWSSGRKSLSLDDVNGDSTDRCLDVTFWRFDQDLRLIFANAEMLSGLAPGDAGTLAIGYANGMEGYVAPPEDYPGGGYEIDGFLARFGLSARFSPANATAFRDAVSKFA